MSECVMQIVIVPESHVVICNTKYANSHDEIVVMRMFFV